MKIKAYDKYHNQHLLIVWDDEINIDAMSSMYSSGNLYTKFEIDMDYYREHPTEYAEDPRPKRWSDLTDFEIIK